MPIYEYQCGRCGDFDVMQKITEKPLRKCPTCKRKVRKLMSNTAFQLRGTGWYVTDYANKGKKAESPDGKDGKDGKGAAATGDGSVAGSGSTGDSEKPSAGAGKKARAKGESAAA